MIRQKLILNTYASKCIKIGEELIQYGNKHSQIRSTAMGHHIKGCGYVCFGNINKSEAFGEQAVAVSADPFYKFIFMDYVDVT